MANTFEMLNTDNYQSDLRQQLWFSFLASMYKMQQEANLQHLLSQREAQAKQLMTPDYLALMNSARFNANSSGSDDSGHKTDWKSFLPYKKRFCANSGDDAPSSPSTASSMDSRSSPDDTKCSQQDSKCISSASGSMKQPKKPVSTADKPKRIVDPNQPKKSELNFNFNNFYSLYSF